MGYPDLIDVVSPKVLGIVGIDIASSPIANQKGFAIQSERVRKALRTRRVRGVVPGALLAILVAVPRVEARTRLVPLDHVGDTHERRLEQGIVKPSDEVWRVSVVCRDQFGSGAFARIALCPNSRAKGFYS